MPCARHSAAFAPERLVREVGAARAGLGPGADRDAHVGAERVGLRGEHRVVVARRVERDGRALVERAGGGSPAPSAASPGSTTRKSRRSRSRRAWRRSASRSRTAATDPSASEPTLHERGDGRRTAHAVGSRARVRAGTRRSAVSVSGPRMPSSRPASKPSALSRRWSSLTSSPRSIGDAHVEQAVAERVAALDQRAPRLGPADPVDPHAASVWNSRTAARVSSPKHAIERDGVTTLREALLEVTDRVAAIADAQESVGRAQAMQRSSDELGELLEELRLALGADEALLAPRRRRTRAASGCSSRRSDARCSGCRRR